jgi:fatty acid desaturase
VPRYKVALLGGVFGGVIGGFTGFLLQHYGWLTLLAAWLFGVFVVTYLWAQCAFEPVPNTPKDGNAYDRAIRD